MHPLAWAALAAGGYYLYDKKRNAKPKPSGGPAGYAPVKPPLPGEVVASEGVWDDTWVEVGSVFGGPKKRARRIERLETRLAEDRGGIFDRDLSDDKRARYARRIDRIEDRAGDVWDDNWIEVG